MARAVLSLALVLAPNSAPSVVAAQLGSMPADGPPALLVSTVGSVFIPADGGPAARHWTDTALLLTVDGPAPTTTIVAPPALLPRDPLTVMLDELVALEGEWVRGPWTCIAWHESRGNQWAVGAHEDMSFLQIVMWWWRGALGRIGRPDLVGADPFDPINQAHAGDAIWRNNGKRWKNQWSTAAKCGLS